jgi:HK97 family phage portal protein
METIAAMAAGLVMHGNYIAVLGEPGANGLPDHIYPVAPDRVQVSRDNGRIIYRIDERVYEKSEIFHIKNFTMPGDLVGRGILAIAKQSLGKEIAINEYASRYFDGGVNPTAVIKSANPDLTSEEADALKTAWMAMYSSRNRSPVVMNASTDFEVLSSNAAYQTALASGFLTVDEVRDLENLDPMDYEESEQDEEIETTIDQAEVTEYE